jgi:hypothetical protein
MPSRLDRQIDRIVAESGGSTQDALRALIQVNEQLEAEVERLRAAVVCGHSCTTGQSLH